MKIYLPRLLGADRDDAQADAISDLSLGEAQEVVLVVKDKPVGRQFSGEALIELGCRVLETDDAAPGLSLLDVAPRSRLFRLIPPCL